MWTGSRKAIIASHSVTAMSDQGSKQKIVAHLMCQKLICNKTICETAARDLEGFINCCLKPGESLTQILQ